LIISHKYKFIFIKTTKTDGTSIEIALSKHCGNKDIITPLVLEDEEMRRSLGYRCSQNYYIPIFRHTFKDWKEFLFKGKKRKYSEHMRARLIRKYISKKVWNSYFKFCVTRNPWDRMISLYYWENKTEPRPSISEFLKTKQATWLKGGGIKLYSINGEIAVDMICLYENLEEDLEKIRIHCGFLGKLTLPNAKSSFRKDRRSYREVLDKEDAEKIRKLASKEIAYFGYEY